MAVNLVFTEVFFVSTLDFNNLVEISNQRTKREFLVMDRRKISLHKLGKFEHIS